MCEPATTLALIGAVSAAAGAGATIHAANNQPEPPEPPAKAIDNSLTDDAPEVVIGDKDKVKRKPKKRQTDIKRTSSTGISIL